MKPLKISIHKMKDGKFQTCFICPKTGQKKRNKFPSMKEAKLYKTQLEFRYKEKGTHAFFRHPISFLMKYHIEKCPNTKVAGRKMHFIDFLETFGNHNVTDLEISDLRAWLEKIKKERGVSDKTLNGIKHQLNYFFHFLVDEGILKSNPLSKIIYRRDGPLRRQRVILSVSEVDKILMQAKRYDPWLVYPYIYFMAHTGVRRQELLKLKRVDIDLEVGLATFRNTKNGTDRTIKLPQGVLNLLKKHLNQHESEYLICNRDNSKVIDGVMYDRFRRFKRHFPHKKNWTFHSLRHSLAHNFLLEGGEMYQLQAILGHKNINMTIDLYGQLKAQQISNYSPYKE